MGKEDEEEERKGKKRGAFNCIHLINPKKQKWTVASLRTSHRSLSTFLSIFFFFESLSLFCHPHFHLLVHKLVPGSIENDSQVPQKEKKKCPEIESEFFFIFFSSRQRESDKRVLETKESKEKKECSFEVKKTIIFKERKGWYLRSVKKTVVEKHVLKQDMVPIRRFCPFVWDLILG